MRSTSGFPHNPKIARRSRWKYNCVVVLENWIYNGKRGAVLSGLYASTSSQHSLFLVLFLLEGPGGWLIVRI
jgi:hypothetical protein